jgi:DedD protein
VADLTHDSADDAFHEIQLSGKQLVFLFMATTVVSVVIFLCGVLVGRSVQADGIGGSPVTEVAADPAPVSQQLPTEPPAAEPPTPATEDLLTYPDRLASPKATTEKLKDDAPAKSDSPRASAADDVSKPSAPSRPNEPPVASPAAQGARPGTWIVQVVSLRDRAAAAQIVQRLKNKGYPAFLVAPTSGGPTQLYKVQVGRYGDRAEAQQVQARLKREEQFEPWIVR